MDSGQQSKTIHVFDSVTGAKRSELVEAAARDYGKDHFDGHAAVDPAHG